MWNSGATDVSKSTSRNKFHETAKQNANYDIFFKITAFTGSVDKKIQKVKYRKELWAAMIAWKMMQNTAAKMQM